MFENLAGFFQEQLTGFRQTNTFLAAFEQFCLQLGFKLKDLVTEGRLSDSQLFGCAAEMEKLGDGQKIAKMS